MPAINEILQNQWKERLEQWQASGLPVKRWCRENGISKPSFYYWRSRLMPSPKNSSRVPKKFVELIDNCPLTTGISGISIEAFGVTVNLMQNFHTESLLRCLQTLRRI
jgi:hypothetical protein